MSRPTPAPLDYLPAEESFHDPLRADAGAPEKARAVVIPFGLEASVSYGGGTAAGPAAILSASHQLELFDEEVWREPYLDYGIAAVRAPAIAGSKYARLAFSGSVKNASVIAQARSIRPWSIPWSRTIAKPKVAKLSPMSREKSTLLAASERTGRLVNAIAGIRVRCGLWPAHSCFGCPVT